MPRIESRLQFVDAVQGRGEDFYRVVCEHDLEGIVAKATQGPYFSDGLRTNWLKIKNPSYSQMEGRFELFEPTRHHRTKRRRTPELVLSLDIT